MAAALKRFKDQVSIYCSCLQSTPVLQAMYSVRQNSVSVGWSMGWPMGWVHMGGPWTRSMGWSMDRVHKGGPWTRVHVLYTSQLGAIEVYSCACEDTNLKVLSAPHEETNALQGNYWAPCWGLLSPFWGIIESLLGITKPAENINKPFLGDFVISSAAFEEKTSIIA